LLNVFLAIAVDNLTNAQEMSEKDEGEQKFMEEVLAAKIDYFPVIMHLLSSVRKKYWKNMALQWMKVKRSNKKMEL